MSLGTAHELEDALRAWGPAIHRGLDLVVVRRCTNAERLRLERAHPGVRVLSAPAGRDLRALRELGVSAARGDIVVVQEDSVAIAAVASDRGTALSNADSGEWELAGRAVVNIETGR